MDNIVIKVTADEKGLGDIPKQLDAIKAANDKVEKSAKDNHEKSTTRNKETIDWNTKLSRSFEDLGEGIIAAFAIERLAEFGAESVKIFAEAEEATNKLRFAITEINGESVGSFQILNDQAEQLSANLNRLYKTRDIQGIQGQLANFGLNADKIRELTPVIINLAAATGKTLPEATEKMILAINGQTKGLRDVGIAFKDTGSKTENFNKLLEQTEKFEGAAEEKSHSLAGTIEEQKNKWEHLKEVLGGGISSMLLGIGGTFEDIWHNIKESTLQLLGFDTAAMDLAAKHKGGYGIFGEEANKMSIKQLETYKNINIVTINEYEKTIRGITEITTANTEKIMAIQALQLQLTKENAKADELIAIKNKKIKNDLTLKGEEEAKAAYEKMLKLRAEYDKMLIEIQKKDYEDAEKFQLSQIKNDLERQLAAQEIATEKIYAELIDRRNKLQEIQTSYASTKEQKEKAISEQLKLNEDLEYLAVDHQNKLQKIRDDAAIKEKKAFEDEEKKKISDQDKLNKEQLQFSLEQNTYETDIEKNALKQRFADKKITEEKYKEELNKIELKSMEDRLQIEQDAGVQDLKLMTDIEDKKIQLQIESSKKQKEVLNSLKEISSQIMEGIASDVENNISIIDTQAERQNRMIDEQKILAEKGLKNDLAFEEKKADELTKQKLAEQKKLKQIKELEVFLNSVATYTQQGNNPAEAIGKALGVLAATKAAEAIYAEEGGILGQTNQRSYVGLGSLSRRHSGGGDILLHAQRGEGIIPKNTMENWGLTDNSKFSQFLKNPFNEKLISANRPMIINDNSAVVARLESLEETIKNKVETQINWDEYGQMIETKIQDGIKRATKTLNLTNRKTRF